MDKYSLISCIPIRTNRFTHTEMWLFFKIIVTIFYYFLSILWIIMMTESWAYFYEAKFFRQFFFSHVPMSKWRKFYSSNCRCVITSFWFDLLNGAAIMVECNWSADCGIFKTTDYVCVMSKSRSVATLTKIHSLNHKIEISKF